MYVDTFSKDILTVKICTKKFLMTNEFTCLINQYKV